MKRSKFSDSQILSILKQHEAGVPVSELEREYCAVKFTPRKALFLRGLF
jgi:hypothetical protein